MVYRLQEPLMENGRPEVLEGLTKKKETGSGTVYVTVNFSQSGKPIETFVTLGRAGSEERALTEAIGRLCSVALQQGISVKGLTRQLRGISSVKTIGFGPNKVLSVPDAVGQILEEVTSLDIRTESR